MRFENSAIVMTDAETGIPYARQLTPWELNMVLAQLQALDGGALNARQVAPFILRDHKISEDEARSIIEKRENDTLAAPEVE